MSTCVKHETMKNDDGVKKESKRVKREKKEVKPEPEEKEEFNEFENMNLEECAKKLMELDNDISQNKKQIKKYRDKLVELNSLHNNLLEKIKTFSN